MVKLTEVPDEHFLQEQAGPKPKGKRSKTSTAKDGKSRSKSNKPSAAAATTSSSKPRSTRAHRATDGSAPLASGAGPREAALNVNVGVDDDDDDDDYFTETDSSLSALSHPMSGSSSDDDGQDHESDDDDDDDDDASIMSDASSIGPEDESLAERLWALRDMIPPRRRAALSSSFAVASSWIQTGARWGGKTMWVVSTSALLVLVPWVLASVDEAQMMEMEREMRMQKSANEVLTPGATSVVSQHLAGGASGVLPAGL
ncbi:MAG: hypothetical protein M1826_004741 [Phylliscum demangeonii]|nr:MAG: hypothetical protein M1826_004741 [Phylliscum demangeonii]